MKPLRLLFVLTCLCSWTPHARASVTPPQAQQASQDIDALLEKHWASAKVSANAPASDETFVRRIYLDLAGRIPTAAEARAFLDSTDAGKRTALVETLLCAESYVSHFYNFWADILRLKSHFVNTANVVPAAYSRWIKESLRTNKPYDQFVREMLSARGYCWENGAVGYYLRDPEMPLDNMALTTRVFLGTRIECAQCHDHPFDKWKQTEFYHLAAFTYGNKPVHEALAGVRDAFKAREKDINEEYLREKAGATDGGAFAAQRKKERLDAMEFRKVLNIIRHGIGQLLSPIGMERKPEAVLKLPFDFHQSDGKPGDVMDPKPIFGEVPASIAASDRAEVFAGWLASPHNRPFNRVIVNRLWKRMFGAALVEPLDDLGETTKAMIPELEAYLEKLIVAQGYDMRAFLSVIAGTRAYQSQVSPQEHERGSSYAFTGPLLRRMSAEQVWDSLVALAGYEPDARDLAREARDDRRIQISHMVCDAYLHYDGKAMVDLGYATLAGENALQAREKAARELEIDAKRRGDKAGELEQRRAIGRLERERNETYVRDFLTPLISNLAHTKAPEGAGVTMDENYKMNANPAVFAVETWRKTHVPGYGPPPATTAETRAELQREKQRLETLASHLGYPAEEHPGFVAYCEKSRTEWMRASELDSPAPRGHFLRTMGQSDRDFVENANPNASIPQALALMNGDLISSKGLLSPYSPLMQSIAKAPDKVDAVYLALLARKPAAEEKAKLGAAISGKDEAVSALIYGLLNTKQFIFIQ